MTISARRFRPPMRLKELMAAPGGKLTTSALEAASANLETLSEACMASVDEKIESLSALLADVGASADARGQMYRLANEIYAEAGTFGRDSLSQAALSLCDLLDRTSEAPAQPVQAITVHVQTMRTLRQRAVESSDELCKAVLEGLRQVTARVTA